MEKERGLLDELVFIDFSFDFGGHVYRDEKKHIPVEKRPGEIQHLKKGLKRDCRRKDQKSRAWGETPPGPFFVGNLTDYGPPC